MSKSDIFKYKNFLIDSKIFLGYNNDFKPSFNGRGGYNKRNDFNRNGSGDSQSSGGFYRANNDDFGNRGGYRSVS
jgi:hypothetical protein